MARLKIFDDSLIHCTIDTINLVDKKSVKKPILVLTRTIIYPKNKFFVILEIPNKESESVCIILSRSALYCFMPSLKKQDIYKIWPVLVKGHLRYKTILCHKVALDVQLMNFFI